MSEVEMLETLKKDYLGMGFKVEIDKYHLKGIAEGLTTTETMRFVDWEDACDWAGKATMNVSCPYVVMELRNLITGEKENF
tara:strand:- start:235 stop:477 length:243 start_codon:yes stop_codon:yes gene_type:complete